MNQIGEIASDLGSVNFTLSFRLLISDVRNGRRNVIVMMKTRVNNNRQIAKRKTSKLNTRHFRY